MTGRNLTDDYKLNLPADANQLKQQSLQQAQEVIYKFLLEIVKKYSPETVLLELRHLLISCDDTVNSEAVKALNNIIFRNNEEEFRNTLTRACYILINNWYSNRKYIYIQELIQLLADVAETQNSLSRSLNRLKSWIGNFINSEDYQEIKLFASPYTDQDRGYWSHRYTSYLLVPQYLDANNPIEQREVARNLSKQLREKFKFDLAMYTVRCDSPTFKGEKCSPPTIIENGGISLIKKIVSRNLLFSYENSANIFLQQVKNINYRDFKESLQNYLFFDVDQQISLGVLKKKLAEKLDSLYEIHHQEILSVDLLLRTCKQLIEFLTTEDGQNPSSLFILLTTQGSTLALVIILLKIILVCKYVRTHLDVCLAQLIHYYENYPENECQWFINFLEIFNIAFAIYTENVQYNLVKVKDKASDNQNNPSDVDLDAYRIFPQLKGADLRDSDLSGADIRSTDLSAADLRGADLSGADLSQANLSLAKLSRANLSSAMLNGAELNAADLNSADLSGASLSGADLRRADLQHVNLSGSSLIDAKMCRSNLKKADLNSATLSSATLNASDLSGANLQNADLQNADLSNANLSNANLSNANLRGADLRHAKLHNANLRGANLHHTNLSHASLRGANLSSTNLSRAELSHGNLRGTDLSDALLRHVNLTGANLSHANLRGANLFSTSLNGVNVQGTKFSENSGLSEGMKRELEQQGAVCELYSEEAPPTTEVRP